jgi:hypothetical protein
MTKVKIIKSLRKKLFPLEIKPGPGAKDKFKKLDPKSPYYNVDELGSPPLHRGGGASGTQKKKQKEVGKKIEEGFKKKDKEQKIRDLQMGGSKYLRGGGIAQRGFGRAFMKGGRVR